MAENHQKVDQPKPGHRWYTWVFLLAMVVGAFVIGFGTSELLHALNKGPSARCQIMEKDFDELSYFNFDGSFTESEREEAGNLLDWYDDHCR